MSEAATAPETAVERILREIAEGIERFTAQVAAEAAAAERSNTEFAETIARIKAGAEQQDA